MIKTQRYRSFRPYYDGVKSLMIKLNMLPTFYSNITLRMASLNLRLGLGRIRELKTCGICSRIHGEERAGRCHLSAKVIF